MSDSRFSTLSFLAEKKTSVQLTQTKHITESPLKQICENIRQFLINPQQINSEAADSYNELLIEAVLGISRARNNILTIIDDQLAKMHIDLPKEYYLPYSSLREAIFAEVVGMNVLEVVIKQYERLEEIQVVGCDIFVVVGGQILTTPYKFQSIKEVERIQQNLVLYNRDVINFDKRWAEVMLQSGARVTLTGYGFTSAPTLTIRFFTMKHISLTALADKPYEMMPTIVVDWIIQLIQKRKNIVIIGKTNSGKTNLLKAMIAEMKDEERIITIESRCEMLLKREFPQRNIIEYEVNDDHRHTAQQALKLALRQSPERIIHAEIRDEDANIYVRACTRGHQGSMTTVHANHLEDVPATIVDMCMLDQRAVDSERLLKRVTEYVTQIGIQLAIVDGKRIIQRLVFYRWQHNQVKLYDILRFNTEEKSWEIYKQCFEEYINDRWSEEEGKFDAF